MGSVIPTKIDDQSSIVRTHMVEENQPLQVTLLCPHQDHVSVHTPDTEINRCDQIF